MILLSLVLAFAQPTHAAAPRLQEAILLSGVNRPEDHARIHELFSGYLELHPGNARALSFYSNWMLLNHQADEFTLAVLRQCLGSDPQNSLCLGNMANYYAQKKDLGSVGRSATECLESQPDNMLCLSYQGHYFMVTKHFARAVTVYEYMDAIADVAPIKFNRELIHRSLALARELASQ